MRARDVHVVVLAGGGVGHVSGGVGTLMLYLMEAWARRGDGPRVHVLDTRGAGGVVGAAFCFMRAVGALAWFGVTGRASLVHAHMTTRGSAVRKCLLCSFAAALGRPTIVHMHGADFMPFYLALRPVWQRVIARTLRRADSVVALGEAWRPFLTERLGVAAERVEIVMNGVPAPAPGRPRTEPAPHEPVRLLFLGRLGARKGVPELLAAFASPELRARAWTAVIAGDGEVERFAAEIAQADLAARVVLPGWTDRAEATRLLRSADILVLPSHHEAMPMSVIEALSHGVAVVTTPVGVVPEFLTDGVDAVLVPPGEAAALAAALADLIDDPVRRRALAGAGHRVFRDRLDIAAIADQMLALYRRAAAAREGSAAIAHRLLGRIALIERPSDVEALIARLGAPDRAMTISFVNQHALNLAWQDRGFAERLGRADVLLRDGIGIGACLRVLGRRPGLNMNGTDFIPALLAARPGRRVALFGTVDPWLGRARDAAAAMGCTVVASLDGYRAEAEYVAAVDASRPDLVVLAMGMPRQERVADAIALAAIAPMVVVNGGAIADFLAGRFARAPALVRKSGFEWAFRLALEPGRLWRRYGPGGAAFALRVLRLRLVRVSG